MTGWRERAEAEAERRYPVVTYDLPPFADMFSVMARRHFIEGWGAALEQYRELLEAAGEYRDADADDSDGYAWENFWLTSKQAQAVTRLLAAAAALPKQEGGEPPPLPSRDEVRARMRADKEAIEANWASYRENAEGGD